LVNLMDSRTERTRCSQLTRSTLNSNTLVLLDIQVQAKGIIIVEKDAIFQRLLDEGFSNVAKQYLLVTVRILRTIVICVGRHAHTPLR
jgi:DNA topoisomerase VI subunit A